MSKFCISVYTKAFLLVLFPLLLLQTGCGSPEDRGPTKPRFVVSIPPLGAILRPVVGARAEVEVLLSGAASPHTHEARPTQVRAAAGATAVFYGAPELDGWAMEHAGERSIALLDLVPDSLQRPLYGDIQPTPEAVIGTDPHFWMDPLAVRGLLPTLVERLCLLDEAGCIEYRAGAARFSAQLDSVDRVLQNDLRPLQGRTLILDHQFMAYFLARYGLQLAAVIEPMPGKEPSPRDLLKVIRMGKEAGVVGVVTLPQLPPRAAKIVAEGLGLQTFELDPVGGVEGRMSYIDLLLYNARVLREALL